jgi:hypothetical protein
MFSKIDPVAAMFRYSPFDYQKRALEIAAEVREKNLTLAGADLATYEACSSGKAVLADIQRLLEILKNKER